LGDFIDPIDSDALFFLILFAAAAAWICLFMLLCLRKNIGLYIVRGYMCFAWVLLLLLALNSLGMRRRYASRVMIIVSRSVIFECKDPKNIALMIESQIIGPAMLA